MVSHDFDRGHVHEFVHVDMQREGWNLLPQRWNSFERLAVANPFPVGLELRAMKSRPFADEPRRAVG